MDILTQKNKKLPFVKVAVGIIWRDDKFLGARRPDDGPRGGFWEFPGGKNEKGESMRETLYRELKEELGIECIEIEEFRVFDYKYPDLHVELHFMNVLSFKNEPVPKIGQSLKWLNSVEAKELNFLAADLNVLDILQQP